MRHLACDTINVATKAPLFKILRGGLTRVHIDISKNGIMGPTFLCTLAKVDNVGFLQTHNHLLICN